MPTSPGAIIPGSTPAAASSGLLKGLFTLQGLAAVGVGAWLLSKRRVAKARRNPRRRNPGYLARRAQALKARFSVRLLAPKGYSSWRVISKHTSLAKAKEKAEKLAADGAYFDSPFTKPYTGFVVMEDMGDKLVTHKEYPACRKNPEGEPAWVILAHGPNPDIPRGYWDGFAPSAPSPVTVPAKSFAAASELCRGYITRNNLGGGNWCGGKVLDSDKKMIALVSYNGTVWRGKTVSEAMNNGEKINPPAAWGRARVKARGKWLKRRFNKNPSPAKKRRNPGKRRAKAHKRILAKWHKARRLIGKYNWKSAQGRKKLAQREKLRRFAFRSGIRGSLLFSSARRNPRRRSNPSAYEAGKAYCQEYPQHHASRAMSYARQLGLNVQEFFNGWHSAWQPTPITSVKKRKNPSHRARRSAALKRALKLRKRWYKLAKKTVKARTGLDTMPGLGDNYSPAHRRWMKQVRMVRKIAGYGTGLMNFIRERGRRAVVGNNPLNIGDSPLASIHGTIGINPRKKRRKGRCGATPGAAAARLAKWRWHHNPKRGRK